MAVTIAGRIIRMTATSDSTSSVFPNGIKVNQITVIQTGAGGNFILRQGTAAAGTIIYDFTTGTDSTINISFSDPQWFENITIDSAALPGGCVVNILTV